PRAGRKSPRKEKAAEIPLSSLYLCRQRPTLPHTFACSTIGPAGLNFRVRDGNGWIPRGKITDILRRFAPSIIPEVMLSKFSTRTGPTRRNFYANVVLRFKDLEARNLTTE